VYMRGWATQCILQGHHLAPLFRAGSSLDSMISQQLALGMARSWAQDLGRRTDMRVLCRHLSCNAVSCTDDLPATTPVAPQGRPVKVAAVGQQ
jgi:hypothetical protein